MDSLFFSSLTKFKVDAGKIRRDDDFSDRFNHTFTTLVLVVFTLVISARQYIGKPIACWVPTEFTRAQEEYAESACWVSSTYFVESNAFVSEDIKARANLPRLHYYQWMPFMLLVQAMLFNIPYIVWRLFNWQSGINLAGIMEVACDIELLKDVETRHANVVYVAGHIEDSLSIKRDHKRERNIFLRCFTALSKCCCIGIGRRRGNYLIMLYLFTKSLYVVNILGQFVLMRRFVGTKYNFYGIDVLLDLMRNETWEESGNFPRIALCDFELRKLLNRHPHTIQCVLPINMFNEKIYIFLWFWCLVVAVISISSFLQWTLKSTFLMVRVDFVRKFLKLRGLLEPGDSHRVYAFVNHFLRQDGVFILRLICINVGELVAAEVTERLWYIYTDHPLAKRAVEDHHRKSGNKRSSGTGGASSSGRRNKTAGAENNGNRKSTLGSSAMGQHKPHRTTTRSLASGLGAKLPPAGEMRAMDEDPGEVV